MAWEQVAGDAVKIGLGALIGAAASYLSAKRTAQTHLEVARFHRENELRSSKAERQEELIGQIALRVEDFHRDLTSYIQLIAIDGDISDLSDQLMRDRAEQNHRRRSEVGPAAVAEARRIAKESNDTKLVHPRIYIRMLGSDDLTHAFQSYERAAELVWIESGRNGDGLLAPERYQELLNGYAAARNGLRGELKRVFPLRFEEQP